MAGQQNYGSTVAWSAPGDCRSIDWVWAQGGGGDGVAGSGGAYYGGAGGNGGGGGGAALKYNIPTTPGEAFTIYVGGNGGFSGLYSGSRGWLCLAYSGSGNAGGAGSVGDYLYNGGNGAPGAANGNVSVYYGGAGGNGAGCAGGPYPGGGGAGAGSAYPAGGGGGGGAYGGGGGGGCGGASYNIVIDPGAVGPGGGGYPGITCLSYTAYPAPVVSSCSPSIGSTGGGQAVTISGANFVGAASVYFAGVPATSVSLVNSNTITCITPAAGAGLANVYVATGGMAGSANVYTYVPPPTFGSCSPPSGSPQGGTAVTITGTNLTNTTGVTFGGTPATSVSVVNANTITCVTPAHAFGQVNVTVVHPAGNATGTNAYMFATVGGFNMAMLGF